MRNALILLAVVLGTSLFATGDSRAQFARCNQDYVNTFAVSPYGDEPGWRPGDIECVEYFRFSFSTPRGERWIRGIGDINVDALLTPGAIAAVERGARRSAERMQTLGDWAIDDTTIFMAFSVSDPAELSDVHDREWKEGGAAAWSLPGQGVDDAECHVTAFLLNDWSAEIDIPYMIAHELFHCVQFGSLSEAQMHARGHWWIEGSAELFAGLAIPEGTDVWDRAPRFDRAVQNERPLYAMQYEAAVFFYWLYQERGIGGLMPFLRGMASSADDAAQRSAIRSQISSEQLLDFAHAYDDRLISYPGGGALRSGPRIDGTTWTINASGEQRRILKPFVIMPGWADYACGRWEATPSDANVEVREEHASDWGGWPAEVDARERAPVRYRVMAMHTGDANVNFTLDVRRTASCASCLTQTVIDRCLIGTWRLTAGGPMEWLRRNGLPISGGRDDLEMTMNEDGTFTSRGLSVDHTVTYPDMVGETHGRTVGTIGRWSVEEGALSACFDGGGEASGVTTLRTPEGSIEMPLSTGSLGGEAGSTSYTCNDTTFFTSAPMPRGEPMTHTFTRQTPRVRG